MDELITEKIQDEINENEKRQEEELFGKDEETTYPEDDTEQDEYKTEEV